MKLIDLLNVLDENCTVFVWAYSAEDPKFNNCTVDWVSPTANDSIDINIDYAASMDEALEVYE